MLVLNSQPPVLSPRATICPSSTGLVVGKTHASQLMLPLVLSESGPPRSTNVELPLNDSALPYLPAVVQSAFCTLPLMPFGPESEATLPRPSFSEYAAIRPVGPFCGVALAIVEKGLVW